MTRKKIVIGVIGSDCHTVGNKIIHNCQGIREKCNEYGLNDILLYVGGNIGSSNEEWEITEKRFREMGFDRIYKPGTPIEETIEDLKKDFNL